MALALPEGARGRALALGLTAVVLAAVWAAAVAPLLAFYADRAEAVQLRTQLAARMAAIAESLPELQRAADAPAANAAPAVATLPGASDALAGAALQSLVEAMASGVGAKLTTTETLPAEAVGAYRRVALRVTVDAATTWPVLVRLLQAIERATPRMFVDDLQIRAQPAPETLKEPPLDISFIVLAFRGAASGDAAPSPGAPPPPGAAP